MSGAASSPSAANEKLLQFLREGRDWEKKVTNIPGIFLIKLPGSKSSSPSLAIEVNPVDSTGAATKKRGLVIRSTSELEQITSLLSNPKINQLANSIDGVNPKRDSATGAKGSSDIFEI
ncbi:MAG: hypothetical protein WCA39_08845 [Nitrososphaeraceae archaeon]